MDYLQAESVESINKIEREQDRLLVWLAHINNLLPYDVRLGDTEITRLSKIKNSEE